MALKLRLNLFYLQDHRQVYGVLSSFYQSIRRPLQPDGNEFYRLDLHEYEHPWVLLDLDGGWTEWNMRRKAFQHVSATLQCTAFSIFVYDGDYWGYEMSHAGEAVDYFVQDAEHAAEWFPGEMPSGNASVVATHLPFLAIEDIEPYLVRYPDVIVTDDNLWTQLNIPAREGDEFKRFSECAVLDFLRLLGVRVELQSGYVKFLAPKWHSFWIQGRQYLK